MSLPSLTKSEYDELHAIVINHIYNSEGVATDEKMKKLRKIQEKLRRLAGGR